MKIRVKGNSVRFRLTLKDMAQLDKEGVLEELTQFPTQTLKYSIESSGEDSLRADFLQNTIRIRIPRSLIRELAHTERIGIEETQGELMLLIEKDFTCLDNVQEDQSDNYPNPNAITK